MSLGFYFDDTRCLGCKSCQVACKDRFDLQKAGPRPRRADAFEGGRFPNAALYHMSIACNHCNSPSCVANCPTGAMFVSDDGTVQHNDDECIGCQACVTSCPYGAPQYLEEENITLKCDSCKALRLAGMNPVCVDSCPMRALDFGEIEELKSKYGNGLYSELPCIGTAEATNPNILIKAKEVALLEDFKEVLL